MSGREQIIERALDVLTGALALAALLAGAAGDGWWSIVFLILTAFVFLRPWGLGE